MFQDEEAEEEHKPKEKDKRQPFVPKQAERQRDTRSRRDTPRRHSEVSGSADWDDDLRNEGSRSDDSEGRHEMAGAKTKDKKSKAKETGNYIFFPTT